MFLIRPEGQRDHSGLQPCDRARVASPAAPLAHISFQKGLQLRRVGTAHGGPPQLLPAAAKAGWLPREEPKLLHSACPSLDLKNNPGTGEDLKTVVGRSGGEPIPKDQARQSSIFPSAAEGKDLGDTDLRWNCPVSLTKESKSKRRK